MEIQTAPDGWRFSTADFSLQAAGKSAVGWVTLIRDPMAKEQWHQQSEGTKESDDGPPLYVSGSGKTFATAMTEASRAALKAAPIEVPIARSLSNVGLCGESVTQDGWHFHMCNKKAKWIVATSEGLKYRCGLHVKRISESDRKPYNVNLSRRPTPNEETKK